MKIITKIIAFTLILSLTSCQQQLIGLFQKGKFIPSTSVVEIPFTLENNLIIIPVKIRGKIYRFLLDTGAPNVISNELAEVLEFKSGRKIKTVDSQGNKSTLNYVLLPKLEIGGATFMNSTAAVADLKHADAIACLGIDGLIGANLMKKAFWQIDSQKMLVRIGSTLNDLQTDKLGFPIAFNTEITGTPYFTVLFGSTEMKRLQLDTGSVGFLSIDNSTYSELVEKNQVLNERISYGINTVGLFGASSTDTTRQVLVSDLMLGNLHLQKQVLDVKRSNQNLLGMSFLKNYLVTIDWHSEQVYLLPRQEILNDYAESFGIGLLRSGNVMKVSFISEGSDAHHHGIQIGDIVLRVNDFDLTDVQLEDYCKILKLVRLKEVDELKMVIQRNGLKDEIVIHKLSNLKPRI